MALDKEQKLAILDERYKTIENELYHVTLNLEYCEYTKNEEGMSDFAKRAGEMQTGLNWLTKKIDEVERDVDIEDAIIVNIPETQE